jgi:hypothetical protein
MKINFIPLHWHKLPALPKPVWAIVAGYGILLIFHRRPAFVRFA